MKICTKCKIEKDEVYFSLKQSICKDCQYIYNKTYYEKKQE